jgi:hypothetical protein
MPSKTDRAEWRAKAALLPGGFFARVKVCIGCGQIFEPKRPNQVRCKPGCRRYAREAKETPEARIAMQERCLAAGRLGAANEMRVAIDFLAHGWDVCTPLSPVCPFDLLVWKEGRALRVQVKTAHEVTRRFCQSEPKIVVGKISGGHDILAMALPDRIVYEPNPGW